MRATTIDKGSEIHRKQIAAIQVSRQQLKLDTETYRAILRRVSAQHGREVESAADLNGEQRRAVLDELRSKGAMQPGKHSTYPGKPHNFGSAAMPEMISKIEAQLADMKLPWSYADAIAEQQHGIAKVAWVREPKQLRAIVAALAVEQEKRALDDAVDANLKRLGWAPERVVELLRPLRPNWRRHRPSLRLVLAYLQAQEA